MQVAVLAYPLTLTLYRSISMSIYKNHRRIYEKTYGPIPEGYEIHHIDGNPLNNDPKNLKAVSIQEHYDIHFYQGDYGACQLIANRMQNGPTSDEISKLASMNNKKRIQSGTHNFLKENVSSDTRKKNKIAVVKRI